MSLYVCVCVCVTTQSELTKQQNLFKIELKLLEDELLSRLSAAESNFLGDNVLVEKLETTKHTAAEIEMKVRGGERHRDGQRERERLPELILGDACGSHLSIGFPANARLLLLLPTLLT